MGLPLEGIKVIDFTAWALGPASCAILGDWGADVIKVEDPKGGDPVRGLVTVGLIPVGPRNFNFELLNHSKRSITIDLEQEQGRDIVHRLVEKTDVFVTSYREVTLRGLGLDYNCLSQINPRLIYARCSGYGQKGPDKDRRGYDYAAFWARGGIMSVLGEPGTPLAAQRPGWGDLTTAMYMAGGIALALFTRERTGVGQEVHLALLGSSIWSGGIDMQTCLSLGRDVIRLSRKKAGNPLFNCYQTKDKWIQIAMMQSDQYWPRFCKALGRSDLEQDHRFDSHERRMENCEILISILDEVFVTKTREEWARLLDRNELIWGPVSSYLELASDLQILENEYVYDFEHPVQGTIKMVASPVKLNEKTMKARLPAPELGQHTEEILLEKGYTWDDIVRLKEQKTI
jgi:crotonobetainyl-CoA:carnitine CoA-transferase CaiB-like acyl-CoA transferase